MAGWPRASAAAPSPTLTSVFPPCMRTNVLALLSFPVSPPAHDSFAFDEFSDDLLVCLRSDSPNKAVMCIFIINHLMESDVFSIFILLVCLGIVVFYFFLFCGVKGWFQCLAFLELQLWKKIGDHCKVISLSDFTTYMCVFE